MAELTRIATLGLDDPTIQVHPSARRLRLRSNATGLWVVLKCDEVPRLPERLERPQKLLVWRQGTNSRFRMLGPDEALALGLAMQGISFAKVREALVACGPLDNTTACATHYLRSWVEAEMVSEIR